MSFDHTEWTRTVHNDTPIYIRPCSTDWFVPNKKADQLIRELGSNNSSRFSDNELRFLERLPDADSPEYPGRAELLGAPRLSELWLHLTDRCNMACSHCLFSSSPSEGQELETEKVLKLIAEAEAEDCKVFALTGGEPFVHPGIGKILNRIMEIEDSHAVVLTNGLEATKIIEKEKIDTDRLHLQVSVDGIGSTHDRMRGSGAFERLGSDLTHLKAKGIPFTLSMCVTNSNAPQMPDIIDFAAQAGASNVHFMWYFVRGRAKTKEFIPAREIIKHLLHAEQKASRKGVTIDNIEAVKSMIFAPCGTIHDGSNSGWESVAVGPDGKLYPSAATVSVPELATPIKKGLKETIEKSEVLRTIRETSARFLASPFRFLFGGGDMDHSYMHNGTFTGDDPYLALHEYIALELITRKAAESGNGNTPGLLLKMGDVLSRCSGHGAVALTHNNCLLAVADNDSLTVVKDFYTRAAETSNDDILNPVCYSEEVISHIPEQYRFRGYGCGSPVMDAGISEGEHVADLGSGRGIECFIAARMTGETGRVTGIDMLDPMLKHARKGQKDVAARLGYDNMEFRKGYLEEMPLEDDCVDLILSNCVLNLSTDKRRTFGEIFRVLKPGGRITVSDVVCESEPGPEIRNDDTLHGECIAGALTVKNLMGLLAESGFEGFSMVKRFPYRKVGGQQFYSLTFSAIKPEDSDRVKALYRGPLASVRTCDGTFMVPGKIMEMDARSAGWLGEQAFIIDEHDNVSNMDIGSSCCCPTSDDFDAGGSCCTPGSNEILNIPSAMKNSEGCMVCGADMEYTTSAVKMTCAYCGKDFESNAHCNGGHFVCDSCHSRDALAVIPHILLASTETDMVELLQRIREHPAIPMHGPEHHALVPGIIATAYRNSGGEVSNQTILTAVDRGSKVAGGYCGFMGVCGAAIGVGVAISTILEATPYTAQARSAAQQGTLKALSLISEMEAARCCQRDSWLALKACSAVSRELLGIKLKSEVDMHCAQMKNNKECMGRNCPVIRNSRSATTSRQIHSEEKSQGSVDVVKKN